MAFIGADEPMEHSMQKLNGLSRSLTPLKPDGTLIAVIEMSPNDGVSDNLSWNCGAEGETSDTRIGILRERQIRNFLTILMLSRGVPMVLAGDEVRRTQKGNNNAYCQDNEISWFDWKAPEKHAGMLRFWHLMIGFRKTRRCPQELIFHRRDKRAVQKVIHALGNAFAPTKLSDWSLTAQSFQHNADLLFGRVRPL